MRRASKLAARAGIGARTATYEAGGKSRHGGEKGDARYGESRGRRKSKPESKHEGRSPRDRNVAPQRFAAAPHGRQRRSGAERASGGNTAHAARRSGGRARRA